MGLNIDVQKENKRKLIKKNRNSVNSFKIFNESLNYASNDVRYSNLKNTIKTGELKIAKTEPNEDCKSNKKNKNINNSIDDKAVNSLKENKIKTDKYTLCTDSYNYEESEKDESKYSKYRHYLGFLYKNNFLSLSFDELCAYVIQFHWRKYYIQELNNLHNGLIEIIYKNEFDVSIFNVLNEEKYTFKCYDINFYRNLNKILEKISVTENNLPIFFVNGYYLGDFTKFSNLINDKIFDKIYSKEYDRSCLKCGNKRETMNNKVCNKCNEKYIYFAINDDNFNIWNERNEDCNKN